MVVVVDSVTAVSTETSDPVVGLDTVVVATLSVAGVLLSEQDGNDEQYHHNASRRHERNLLSALPTPWTAPPAARVRESRWNVRPGASIADGLMSVVAIRIGKVLQFSLRRLFY